MSQSETNLDWYDIGFRLGVPTGTEVPSNWIAFLRWLADRIEKGPGLVDDVVLVNTPSIRKG